MQLELPDYADSVRLHEPLDQVGQRWTLSSPLPSGSSTSFIEDPYREQAERLNRWLAANLTALVDLQREGKVRHIGLSNVTGFGSEAKPRDPAANLRD